MGTGKAEGVRMVGKAGDGGWGRRQRTEKEEGGGRGDVSAQWRKPASGKCLISKVDLGNAHLQR